MTVSSTDILELAARMDERAGKGFRVSARTAPIVIRALRCLASVNLPADLRYTVEQWDDAGCNLKAILAASSLIVIARTAFEAASAEFPQAKLTLRNGAKVIARAVEPDGRRAQLPPQSDV